MRSQIGDSLIQTDSQHLYCKLLIVFGVMKMALAISWCRLQAPVVILYDSLLKGTVGRDLFHAHTGRKDAIHSLFYPDTCTSEMHDCMCRHLDKPTQRLIPFSICYSSRYSARAGIFQLHQQLPLNFDF